MNEHVGKIRQVDIDARTFKLRRPGFELRLAYAPSLEADVHQALTEAFDVRVTVTPGTDGEPPVALLVQRLL